MRLKVYCVGGTILNLESKYESFAIFTKDLSKLAKDEFVLFTEDAIRKDQIIRVELK